MRRYAGTAVLFFCLTLLTSGTGVAATDVDWASSVDAAEAVDPTLAAPPLLGTNVSVVGGGKAIVGGSFPNFAFSAFKRNGEVTGHMTLVGGFGNTMSATVVCVAAAVLPDGRGGAARLVGELDELASGIYPTLVFDVSDAGPGGDGDTWSGFISPLAPLDFPCVSGAGGSPIGNGNVAVRSLD